MPTIVSETEVNQRKYRRLCILPLRGGSAKIFGFWVPPATVADIESPDAEGGRHQCMKRVGVSLSSQGLSAEQIEAVFAQMYGDDQGVPCDEMAKVARWCEGHPGEPCGGPDAVRRAKRTIHGRGASIRRAAHSIRSLQRPKQLSPAAIAENIREFLDGRNLSIDEMIRSSPVPIRLSAQDRACSFGMLCEHLYHPRDVINVVDRAFWPGTDLDGKWQPCGAGEAWRAKTWAQMITPEAVRAGHARAMARDAKLPADEKLDVGGAAPAQESGIPQLDPEQWWAYTRWGAWFQCNPILGLGSGKYGSYTDENIARYPYLLLESDGLPLETQTSILAAKGLPVASIVSSGNRSLHSLVAVQADSDAHFRSIAAKIFSQLAPFGFDPSNSNPSRMTRMPGIIRADNLRANRSSSPSRTWEETLAGKQVLLWLADDEQGAPLPW